MIFKATKYTVICNQDVDLTSTITKNIPGD